MVYHGLSWSSRVPTPTQTVSLHVSEADRGRRLDAFVAQQLHWRSRTALVRLIALGAACINGRVARKSQRIEVGDHISLQVPVEPEQPVDLAQLELRVVFEDDDLIVVDKPPHLAVHPASTCMQLNLLRRLEYRYAQELPDPSAQPSIVHRLDRGTSGVIVYARRRDLVAFYTGQFERRTVRKEYMAIVHGELEDRGELDSPLLARPAQAVVVSPEGKPARTSFVVLARGGGFSLVRVALHTGRKHQIRVHFAAAGHPLVYDDVYGLTQLRDAWPPNVAPMLHSSLIELDHRVQGRVRFEADKPERLLQFWDKYAHS